MRLSLKEKLDEMPASNNPLASSMQILNLWAVVVQLTFEEEGRLIRDQIAREVLRCIDKADDDSSSQVGAFEQIEQGRGTA